MGVVLPKLLSEPRWQFERRCVYETAAIMGCKQSPWITFRFRKVPAGDHYQGVDQVVPKKQANHSIKIICEAGCLVQCTRIIL
jgi:hypothetical protein